MKKFSLSLILVFVVIGSIFFLKSYENRVDSKKLFSSNETKSKFKNKNLHYEFNVYEHFHYLIEQKTAVKIQSSASVMENKSSGVKKKISEQFQEITVRGDLIEKIHDISNDKNITDGDILVGFVLNNAKIDWGKNLSNNERETTSTLEQQLANEVFVLMDRYRQFKEFYVGKDYSPESANIIKALILSTQVVLPRSNSSNWITHEKNMTGPYKSNYRCMDSEVDDDSTDTETNTNLLDIRKSKLYYKHFEMDEQGMVLDQKLDDLPSSQIKLEPNSFNKIVFDSSQKHFKSIHEFEEHKISSLNILVSSKIETKITLLRKWQQKFSSLLISDLKSKTKEKEINQTAIIGGEISVEQRLLILKKLIAGNTTENIVSKLENIDFSKDGQKLFDYFRILRAIVELNPKEHEKILDAISSLDTDTNESKYQEKVAFLIGTLSKMNAIDAQNGLINLINNNLSNKILMEQAIITLADLKNPTSEQQKFISNLFHSATSYEIKSLSALGLGLLANNAQITDPQLSKESNDELLHALENSQNDRETRTMLTALGNSGHQQIISSLQKHLHHSDEDIRALAVYGLRFIPGEISFNLITETIKREKSQQVLDHALQALSFKPVSEQKLSVLIDVFTQNMNVNVQEQSLRIINDLYPHFPDKIKEIIKSAKKSRHEKIREMAIDLELTH